MKHSKTAAFRNLCSLLILVVLDLAPNALRAQTIYYADASRPDNSGAGTSWGTAKKDLQSAIDLAGAGDQVWVRAGNYLPTSDPFGNSSPADPRDKCFFLKNGVSVYGGFNGTETTLAQRNVSANITILSGDIGNSGDNSDNCYHVVLAVFTDTLSTCRVDGFTISGGNANAATSLTVNGLTAFRNNGGGIYFIRGKNTIAHNILTANSASSVGGAIATTGGPVEMMASSTFITENNISQNNAAVGGGGIYMVLCTDTLSNNTIQNNSSAKGGGLYCNGGSQNITHNTISANSATGNGGGIFFSQSNNSLTANSIYGNSATAGGGFYQEVYTLICTDNVIRNNSAVDGAGMYAAGTSNNIYRNNTIFSNSASGNGGGLYSSSCQGFVLQNNIFWANTTGGNNAVAGADYYEGGTAGNSFYNNILQLASGNYSSAGSGNYDLGTAASGNLFATDPLFTDPAHPAGADNIDRTADDGLRLQAGSPAINAGQLSVQEPGTDITDALRGVAPFDLGAYEWYSCSGSSSLFVDASVAVSGSGYSWAQAFKTLDEALFVAHNCPSITRINVAAGVYVPGKKPYENGIEISTADPRDVCFYLRDSLSLYGGYPSGGGTRDPSVNISTLSGDIGVSNDASDNCYHVVLLAFGSTDARAVVDGFTISGGNANASSFLTVNAVSTARNQGGGIYCRMGHNILTHNVISHNNASSTGGGLVNVGGPGALMASSNTITQNTFSGNSALSGGGLYAVLCTDTLSDNLFSSNSAGNGAGFYLNGVNYLIRRNTIGNNSASISGGGEYLLQCTGVQKANSIAGNSATVSGGGIFQSVGTDSCYNTVIRQNSAGDGGGLYIDGSANNESTNNTIFSNSASGNGGGLCSKSCSNFQLRNDLFWGNQKGGNTQVQGSDYYEAGTNGNNFNTCLLQLASSGYTFTGSGAYDLGATGGANIFATDPQFTDPANPAGADNTERTADDGLRIPCSSPATESGSSALAITTDILGNTRNGTRDIGAYEANGSSAVDALPTTHTIVSAVQPAGILDYSSCLSELVKLDASAPYTLSGNTTVQEWIESSQPATYVRRHYEITPASNASAATARVTLYFTQADFNDFNAVSTAPLPVNATDAQGKANLRILKISGVSSDGSGQPSTYSGTSLVINPADADIVWNNTAARWEVSFNVSGFSGFFVQANQTALPLRWLGISGDLNAQQQAVIRWRVEEQDIASYTVEKTVDGIHFVGLATIPSTGNGAHEYSFTENAPLGSTAFYRIRQTGIDGIIGYSAILRLSGNQTETALRIYPNPVKDIIHIEAGAALQGKSAVLTDASGQVLQRLRISQRNFQIDLGHYSSGLYLLRVENGNTFRIVKE